MAPERDLGRLLAGLDPQLQKGEWVFCEEAPGDSPDHPSPLLRFAEQEGDTVVLSRGDAVRAGLAASEPLAWITLSVRSDLAAVGLLAQVAGALAEAGIACNVVSAYHHDHLFVPLAEGQRALSRLRKLQASPGFTGLDT